MCLLHTTNRDIAICNNKIDSAKVIKGNNRDNQYCIEVPKSWNLKLINTTKIKIGIVGSTGVA